MLLYGWNTSIYYLVLILNKNQNGSQCFCYVDEEFIPFTQDSRQHHLEHMKPLLYVLDYTAWNVISLWRRFQIECKE